MYLTISRLLPTFCKRDKSNPFCQSKATPINLFIHLGGVSHGDPHDDIQEDLK